MEHNPKNCPLCKSTARVMYFDGAYIQCTNSGCQFHSLAFLLADWEARVMIRD